MASPDPGNTHSTEAGPRVVEKVTAFITRAGARGTDLLLFEHPYAGIQIPAGTVEIGETPQEAVLREVAQETGLIDVRLRRSLGCAEKGLPDGQRAIVERTRVYARPDATSFDWAYLRRGIRVSAGRRAQGFTQITYQEFDRVPEPQYLSMSIVGWVPDRVLADTQRRTFYHLEYTGPSEERWTVFADNHDFTLFWASLVALPEIIPPQDQWLEFLREIFPECALA